MARIAVLLDDDFEDTEYSVPARTLRRSDHELVILGVEGGRTVHGKQDEVTAIVDAPVEGQHPEAFDAVLIPGGYSPDRLRTHPPAIDFLRRFSTTGRPIAAVCHGPQLLISAELVDGRRMTSWPSVRVDLENAGATWVDAEVVRDGPFITSRKPEDLEAFTEALLENLSGVAASTNPAEYEQPPSAIEP